MLENYDIDWEGLKNNLKKLNPKRIFVELPEGLKPYIFEIMKNLEGFELYFSGENIYGACDVPETSKNFDVTLHFGHSEIPNINYGGKIIFVEMKRKMEMDEKIISKFINLKCSKIGLLATVQYIDHMKKLSMVLSAAGIKILVTQGDSRLKYPGQVLGCDFSAAMKIGAEVDCFVVIADGEFHARGVAISTGKRTYSFDPIRGEINEINIEKLLRQRYAMIEKARSSRFVGIIVSQKIGQIRWNLALSLKEKIEKFNKKAAIIIMDEINPYKIRNLPMDIFVNTACPRVSTDDSESFDYKLITPQEMEMALGVRPMYPYFMDMIHNVDTF